MRETKFAQNCPKFGPRIFRGKIGSSVLFRHFLGVEKTPKKFAKVAKLVTLFFRRFLINQSLKI